MFTVGFGVDKVCKLAHLHNYNICTIQLSTDHTQLYFWFKTIAMYAVKISLLIWP